MQSTRIIARRPTHVGVINQAMWSAHDRRVAGDNGVPAPSTTDKPRREESNMPDPKPTSSTEMRLSDEVRKAHRAYMRALAERRWYAWTQESPDNASASPHDAFMAGMRVPTDG